MFLGQFWWVWCLWLWHNRRKTRRKENLAQVETASFSGTEMVSGNKTFARFTLEEIKKATNNFSRHNIIGL